MIRILKDCFDKHGNRYKVISFSGGLYQCQSYLTGKSSYFQPNEISTTMPSIKTNKRMAFTDMIKEELKKEEVAEVEVPVATVSEPSYVISEPSYEEEKVVRAIEPENTDILKREIFSQDNVKETAEDDFYADF